VTLRGSLLAAVLTLALALRLWVLHSLRFDGLYGQDAFAYYYHGLAIWRDHSLSYPWPWLPRPLPLFFPLGESALLAGVFSLLERPDSTAALGVSVVCGTLSVALVFGIALRIADRLFDHPLAAWTAALAAAPLALAGLQVQASDTIMSDAPALFWGTAAIWLWTLPAPGAPAAGAGVTTPREREYAGLLRAGLAGFAAGVCYALAVSTRWEYAVLALAMAAYWWADADHTRAGYRAYRMPIAALIGAVLAGIPQFLYSLHNSDPVLHHQWLTGWSPAHLWQATFATVDGVQRYPMSAGAFYLVRPLLSPQILPFTLAPFLPLGIAALATGGTFTLRPDGRSIEWLLLLLCWWLAPALYLAGVPFESARFTLVYTPPLAMLEAIGIVATVRALTLWLGGRAPLCPQVAAPTGASGGSSATHPAGPGYVAPAVQPRRRTSRLKAWIGGRGPACLAIACAVLGLGAQAVDARDGVAALAQGKTGDLLAVAWLRDHTPSGASIATFGLTLMLYHYGDPADHRWRLLDLSAADTAELARAVKNPLLTVVVNEGNLASQWHGLPPQLAFSWLQAHARLRPVADAGGYTILSQGGAG
jgi:hypothetical protein